MGADEGSVVTEDEDTPKQWQRYMRVGLVGTSSADRIRASGHARRIKQAGHMAAPDRNDIRAAFTSCEVGAVHTWRSHPGLPATARERAWIQCGGATHVGVRRRWAPSLAYEDFTVSASKSTKSLIPNRNSCGIGIA